VPHGAARKDREGQGIDKSYGDQDGRCQDEGDRAAFRVLGRGLVQDRDRHHQAVVFAVKPAAGFDLMHFFARRDLDRKGGFDRVDLRGRRFEEVDPDGIARHCLRSVFGRILQAAWQHLGSGLVVDDGARGKAAHNSLGQDFILVDIGGNHAGLRGVNDYDVRPEGIGKNRRRWLASACACGWDRVRNGPRGVPQARTGRLGSGRLCPVHVTVP
jgi:hypothetical protein